VDGVLDSLRARGYTVGKLLSFWGDEGRHNGLNVTVTDRSGIILEIQFPTELSRAVGKATHHYYEIVRQADLDVRTRVEAFLSILRINKESGINHHRPTGLESLGKVTHANTTFDRWIRGIPTGWPRYLEQLRVRETSFDEVLHERGLNRDDALGPDRTDEADA
jgi:hypothetical protein